MVADLAIGHAWQLAVELVAIALVFWMMDVVEQEVEVFEVAVGVWVRVGAPVNCSSQRQRDLPQLANWTCGKKRKWKNWFRAIGRGPLYFSDWHNAKMTS